MILVDYMYMENQLITKIFLSLHLCAIAPLCRCGVAPLCRYVFISIFVFILKSSKNGNIIF
jgi:hypothetical protein